MDFKSWISSGFHLTTNLMLSPGLFMLYLGYNGYINMYFYFIMVIDDGLT